jgi:hypothetical protein
MLPESFYKAIQNLKLHLLSSNITAVHDLHDGVWQDRNVK